VAESDPLVRVCSLLNKHSAKYLIIGGHACILHGLVRTTEDVDLLVEGSEENLAKVIAALSEMEDGTAKELTPRDLLDNVVVKIADEVEVDVSRSAWKISYDDAIDSALHVEIDGVDVPYVDLKTLLASKETPREQDRADVMRLKRLLEQQRGK
jgi:predicted nucleotidyltransferase